MITSFLDSFLDSFLSFGFNQQSSNTVSTKSVYLEQFLISGVEDITLCPKFKPPITSSTYLLDTTFIDRNYSNLVYLQFNAPLTLSERHSLRSYLLSHDPESYTIQIENDLWRGFLINNEPRKEYFTDGSVLLTFEVEYCGIAS